MKKIAVSLLVVGSFATYAYYQRTMVSPVAVAAVTNAPVVAAAPPVTAAPVPPPMVAARAEPVPAPRIAPPAATLVGMGLRDGTYTGDATDAYFGTMQVQAIVADGRITDVRILDYPHDRSRSQRINQSALPALVREAIQAQSASVNIVSGATPTSRAFAQSLASAIRHAQG